MDGISDHRLRIENMTREEICTELNRLVDWSLNTEYFPGKVDHKNHLMVNELCNELDIRRLAE